MIPFGQSHVWIGFFRGEKGITICCAKSIVPGAEQFTLYTLYSFYKCPGRQELFSLIPKKLRHKRVINCQVHTATKR